MIEFKLFKLLELKILLKAVYSRCKSKGILAIIQGIMEIIL